MQYAVNTRLAFHSKHNPEHTIHHQKRVFNKWCLWDCLEICSVTLCIQSQSHSDCYDERADRWDEWWVNLGYLRCVRGVYSQPWWSLSWKRPQNLHLLVSGLTAAALPAPLPTGAARPATQQEVRQSGQKTLRPRPHRDTKRLSSKQKLTDLHRQQNVHTWQIMMIKMVMTDQCMKECFFLVNCSFISINVTRASEK